MNNKIIERIKKMFALANCEGASEGEAENAMRMATKLMDKYNLSSMDLHNKEDLTIKFEDASKSMWVHHIYNAVAKLYSCGYFKNKENCLIVGTISDSTTASIVSNGLIDSINKAGKGKGIAFKNGASLEIVRQCYQLIEDRKKNKTNVAGTGLVLADVYNSKLDRVQDYMNKNLNITNKKNRRMKITDEGRNFGRKLNPHAHLSSKKALN